MHFKDADVLIAQILARSSNRSPSLDTWTTTTTDWHLSTSITNCFTFCWIYQHFFYFWMKRLLRETLRITLFTAVDIFVSNIFCATWFFVRTVLRRAIFRFDCQMDFISFSHLIFWYRMICLTLNCTWTRLVCDIQVFAFLNINNGGLRFVLR